jgi:hypothetical protein
MDVSASQQLWPYRALSLALAPNHKDIFTKAPLTQTTSSDNDARAMRVAEIMADFRNLQYYIAQIQANPPPEDYYLEGYALLRACVTEAQAILASPYAYGAGSHPQGEPETEKSQLQAYVPVFWLETTMALSCPLAQAEDILCPHSASTSRRLPNSRCCQSSGAQFLALIIG